MKRDNKKSLLIIIIIALIAVLAGAAIFMRKEAPSGDKATPVPETKEEGSHEPVDVLFLASDYQHEEGWDAPADTLSGILKAITADGMNPTNAIICGDYSNDRHLHDYQLSPDQSISEIRDIVSADCSSISQEDMVFVQGNHDKLTGSITQTGLHEYDNYLVYVLNTEHEFPWKQGRDTQFRERVINAAADMQACFDKLIESGETRPVIIAGHVPLHFTARTSSRHDTGDNMYAEYIFDVVNNAANSLDIVYLTGHNHSKGWDCYLGGSSVFKRPGETILIPEAGTNTASTDDFTVEALNFTYMNAGYLGYYMNCGHEELDNGTYEQYHAADETLTGSICEIMPDELVFYRYSSEGLHPLSWEGEADPYMDHIDRGLIDENSYSHKINSPVHIPRKNRAENS